MDAAPAAAGRSCTGRRALVVRARVTDGSTAQWLEQTGWDLVLVEENRDTRRGAYLIQLDQTTPGAPAPQGHPRHRSRRVTPGTRTADHIRHRSGLRPHPPEGMPWYGPSATPA